MDGQSAGSIAAAFVGSRAADCAVVDKVSPTADCVGTLETHLLDEFSPAGTVTGCAVVGLSRYFNNAPENYTNNNVGIYLQDTEQPD